MRKLKRFLFPLLLILGLLILSATVVVLYVPVMPMVQSFRADRLMEESLELAEAGEAKEAYDRALAAYLLSPESPDLLLNAVRLSLAAPTPGMHALWNRALPMDERTPEDLKAYVLFLKEEGHPGYRILLPRLVAELPEDPEIGQFYFERLLEQRRSTEAAEWARPFVDSGSASEEWLAGYLNILLNSPDPSDQSEGRRHLNELMQRPSPMGAVALRYALRSKQVPPAEKPDLAARLLAHPHKKSTDGLLRLEVLQMAGEDAAIAEAREAAFQALNLNDPDVLTKAAFWLAQRGDWTAVGELLDAENSSANADLRGLWLQSLINNEAAERAYATTLDETVQDGPLSQMERLIYRSRALHAMGEMDRFEDTLRLAVEICQRDEVELLQGELIALNRIDNLTHLYERIGEDPDLRLWALQRLITIYYEAGNEPALIRTLAEMDIAEIPGQPALTAFIAYLNFIHGRDLRASRARVEGLLARYPGVIDFRLVLGLHYLLAGEEDQAWEIAGINLSDMQSGGIPRHLKLASVVLHASRDKLAAIEPLLAALPRTRFLAPEEALLERFLSQ
jgi:hypothetical protein